MVQEVKTEAEFNQVINGEQLVVVDFYATWCGPCRFISPKVVELSKKYPQAVFLKVDVDAVPSVAMKCEISAMPTFQLYLKGQKIDEVIGADPNRLEAAITQALAKQ